MKNAILVLTFCFLAFQSQAQLNIGLKGGAMFSSIQGENIESGTRTGLGGGLFAQFVALPALAIQVEGLFEQKGSYDESTPLGINTVSEVRLDYLTIPVMAKLRLPIGGTVFPNVFGGMYGAYALNGELATTIASNTSVSDLAIEDFDFGLLFGGGLDIKLEKLFLTFDARYSFGLVEVYNDNSLAGAIDDFRNGAVFINVGIGTTIGR